MYISMDNDKDFDHWMKLATVSYNSHNMHLHTYRAVCNVIAVC